jgi:hypothetical protein
LRVLERANLSLLTPAGTINNFGVSGGLGISDAGNGTGLNWASSTNAVGNINTSLSQLSLRLPAH